MALISTAMVIGVSWLSTDSPEFALRIAGFLLQLLGLGAVVKGLNDTRRLFGRRWIKPIPSFYPTVHYLQAQNMVQENSVSSGRIEVINKDSRVTLDTRLSELEARFKVTQADILDVNRRLGVEAENLKNAIDEEQRRRSEEDGRIYNQLETAVVGGIMFEAVGVSWLAFGVGVSSFPRELADILGKLLAG